MNQSPSQAGKTYFIPEELFENHIQRLEQRTCPKGMIKILRAQKSIVLETIGRISFHKGEIIFLPVIPVLTSYKRSSRLCLTIKQAAEMIVSNGKQGQNLIPASFVFRGKTEPYWIYAIEKGERTKGKTPYLGKLIIERNGKRPKRRPLDLAEAIALCVHTNVLSEFSIWAALGIESIKEIIIPHIQLNKIGEPQITLQKCCPPKDEITLSSATPSCIKSIS